MDEVIIINGYEYTKDEFDAISTSLEAILIRRCIKIFDKELGYETDSRRSGQRSHS